MSTEPLTVILKTDRKRSAGDRRVSRPQEHLSIQEQANTLPEAKAHRSCEWFLSSSDCALANVQRCSW